MLELPEKLYANCRIPEKLTFRLFGFQPNQGKIYFWRKKSRRGVGADHQISSISAGFGFHPQNLQSVSVQKKRQPRKSRSKTLSWAAKKFIPLLVAKAI